MQNRYVGDVGDFAKYALLRRMGGTSVERPVRIAVVWCLFPDESHNNDGRHVSYVRRPEFADLDDKLLKMLRQIIKSGKRSISAVASAQILPKGTIFCNKLVSLPKGSRSKGTDRLLHRSSWLEGCLKVTSNSELIFFDPDNGLEVSSIPKHDVKAGKYIYWDELELFWSRGHALLIYHHLNRTKPAADQVALLTARIQANFEGGVVKALVFRRGSCRVFWLVCRPNSLGSDLQRRAEAFLSGNWSKHFRSFD